jgi:DeoR/GlpR family transcriptional regulator of sugar metabolism
MRARAIDRLVGPAQLCLNRHISANIGETMRKPAAPRAASTPPRFAQERQQEIAQALRANGRVEVAALAAHYDVSEDTIRRDLRLLADHGLVQKTHGGAVALHTTVIPAAERAGVRATIKRAIARAAAAHVQPHQTLFIDGGTTTLALAQLLRAAGAPRPLTIVTTALDVANALLDDRQVKLVLAGGAWVPESRIFEGPQAVATLHAHRADIVFLGACALHRRVGLTSQEAGDMALKRAMIDGAAQRIVLTDASKLDTVAPHAVCALAEIDRVICDAAPSWLRKQVTTEVV